MIHCADISRLGAVFDIVLASSRHAHCTEGKSSAAVRVPAPLNIRFRHANLPAHRPLA
jgi:hypothetical protein